MTKHAAPPQPKAMPHLTEAVAQAPQRTNGGRPAVAVFLTFLRLGCTSFGGPIAHLGYFRKEFVERQQWLDEASFAELVALAQSLPGPASSQVGFAIGLRQAGIRGGLAAWLGFTLPSALLMLLFASGRAIFASTTAQAVLHGLQLVAVAVVAQAVWSMWKQLAPDRTRSTLAVAAAGVVLFIPAAFGTVLAIVVGLTAGLFLLRLGPEDVTGAAPQTTSRRTATLAAAVFTVLFFVALRWAGDNLGLGTLFASFFRSGALVFGGGHVVLPLLESSVVHRGWEPEPLFLSGYGLAQALPGPLFAFAAYAGAVIRPSPHPLTYGLVALVGLFLPGMLLITAVLPFWQQVRQQHRIRRALQGINAAVVGVLLAALYTPVWTSTVHSALDFILVSAAFVGLVAWQLPPWAVVLGMGLLQLLAAVAHPSR